MISETEQHIEKKRPWPFEGWRTFTLKHADHLVGRSSEAVEVAHRKGYAGLSTGVPNGVDVDSFRPLPERESLRTERKLSGFVVGYVAAGKEATFESRIKGGKERNTVRVWIGIESARCSRTDKARKHESKMEVHADVPDPIPASTKVWNEVETESGKSKASLAYE